MPCTAWPRPVGPVKKKTSHARYGPLKKLGRSARSAAHLWAGPCLARPETCHAGTARYGHRVTDLITWIRIRDQSPPSPSSSRAAPHRRQPSLLAGDEIVPNPKDGVEQDKGDADGKGKEEVLDGIGEGELDDDEEERKDEPAVEDPTEEGGVGEGTEESAIKEGDLGGGHEEDHGGMVSGDEEEDLEDQGIVQAEVADVADGTDGGGGQAKAWGRAKRERAFRVVRARSAMALVAWARSERQSMAS